MTNLFFSCKESRIENFRSLYGCFYLGPFNESQCLTIANALRRTLLSELTGIAITSIEIEGIFHEYSTIEGVRESVMDILLNLKEIVLKTNQNLKQTQTAYICAYGPGVIRAADIKLPPSIQCVDPNQYIATLSDNGFLNMKLKINQGKSYVIQNSFNFKKQQTNSSSTYLSTNHKFAKATSLPIDAVFMPINKVNYIIERNYLNEQKEYRSVNNEIVTNENSHVIVLEVWTNGSVHPRDAVYKAFQYLMLLFTKLSKIQLLNSIYLKSMISSSLKFRKISKNLQYDYNYYNEFEVAARRLETQEPISKKELMELEKQYKRELIDEKELESIDIGNLNMSLRPYICLKKANINNLAELIKYSPKELLKIRNFGKKCLEEVQNSLEEVDLELAIDL